MAIAEQAEVRRPGWAISVPAVLQHFGLGAVTLVIPRLIAQAAGLDGAAVESYCQIAMIAVGIATLLQAWGWRGIGSGPHPGRRPGSCCTPCGGVRICAAGARRGSGPSWCA